MKQPTPLNKAYVRAMAIKMAIPFHCEIAGSIRREEPVVGDIDLVVTVPELELKEHHARVIMAEVLDEAIQQTPAHLREEIRVLSGGPRRATARYGEYVINLWCGLPEEQGALLMYATGPARYNSAYRRRAKKMGFLLNEKGLWSDGRRVAGHDECSIYTALGKPWKAPRLRGKSFKTSSPGKGVIIDG